MSLINKLNKSRSVILNIVEKRGFDIKKYSNFTLQELDVMISSTSIKNTNTIGPLDMIFDNKNKLIVKFIINQKLRITNLTNLIQDIITTQLQENDTLILITNDKLNSDNFDDFLETIYQKNKIFIQIFWIETIMRDITQHFLVPNHEIIDLDEKETYLKNII